MGEQIDRINGLVGSIAIKAPVRVATTENITLSGVQTIDDIAVVADDRVLVKDQTDASENGIYDASSSAWIRAADWDGARDIVQGTKVNTQLGTVNAGITYKVDTADPIVIGTTEITFSSSTADAETAQAAAEDAQAAAEVAQAAAEDAQAAAEAAAATLLNIKVIDIGDWDMDTNQTKVVDLGSGVTSLTLRSVFVQIRDDNYVSSSGQHSSIYRAGAAWFQSDTGLILDREAAGLFDSASYDGTGFSRGWVTVWYTD
jgi:hypothetical protein